ncbi:MAG: hypothetical protein JWP74_3060 [Marmoricola sp.]|nr:hypothetical protein [Marmoricola sp.]
MDPHLAELSRTIEPAVLGQRMRNARIAAGMTQSQVAGDDASTAYVSRIEDGQRRPEAHLLERLAVRMGTTLEELLLGVTSSRQTELRVEIEYAEIALVSGTPQDALARIESTLVAIGDDPLPRLRRDAQLVRARALEATGRNTSAITLLEEIVEDPLADARWLSALTSLSRCYRESGDLTRAIEVGERAAARIDALGLAGLPEAVELTVTVAAAQLSRGDVEPALNSCRSALADTGLLGSPVEKAHAYWNASIRELKDGSADAALDLARKSLLLFEVGEHARNVGRLRTQFATLQLKLDPPDAAGAREILEAAQREPAWMMTSAPDKAQHHLVRARAAFVLGDHATACDQTRAAAELIGTDAPLLLAEIRVLEGQVAANEGQSATALAAYRDAIGLLTDTGTDRDVAQLWFELGTQLDEVGEHDDARDAYRRAAASSGLRAPVRA